MKNPSQYLCKPTLESAGSSQLVACIFSLLLVISAPVSAQQAAPGTFGSTIAGTVSTIISVLLQPEDCNIPGFSSAQCANVIQTQAQVNQYPLASVIQGDLVISPQSNLDLTRFNTVEEIRGSLSIIYGQHNSFTGFNGLRHVGRGVVIKANSQMTILNGFQSLLTIGLLAGTSGSGSLDIMDNPALSQVTGFQALQTIGAPTGGVGGVNINNNPVLSQVSGFQALQSIRDMSIRDNAQLQTLPAFNALTTVRSNIVINGLPITSLPLFFRLQSIRYGLTLYDLPSLTQLPSFASLTAIEKISIQGLEALTAITGFNNVTSLVWELNIVNNPELVTISGFRQLSQVGGRGSSLFYMTGNAKLSRIAITGTGLINLDHDGVIGDIYVSNNPMLSCPVQLPALGPMFHSYQNLVNCDIGR